MCLHTEEKQSVSYNPKFKHIHRAAGALLDCDNVTPGRIQLDGCQFQSVNTLIFKEGQTLFN